MFDRRFALTGAALAMVAALAFAVSSPDADLQITPIAENVSGVEKHEKASPSAETEYAYLLKEYNGRVAVYPAGSQEPELVLDVLVKYLPDYDRSQMKLGIPVKDYNQLVSLIEDYTS